MNDYLFSLLGVLGVIITYLGFVFRYVPPPFCWVIEKNFPGMETVKTVWHPGIHFLWIPIEPFMFVRAKWFCADSKMTMTIGVSDNNPGGPSLVEFIDSSAGVIVQIVLRVTDPIMATYEASDAIGMALQKIEADFRKILSTFSLDEAMSNADKRSQITKDIFKEINAAIKAWGIELTNPGEELTIIDFVLSPETLAQRGKILQAKKDAEVTVTLAKAEREANILRGKGIGKSEAKRIAIIAEQLQISEAEVMKYIINKGLVEAFNSPGSTFFATKGGLEEMLATLLAGAKAAK